MDKFPTGFIWGTATATSRADDRPMPLDAQRRVQGRDHREPCLVLTQQDQFAGFRLDLQIGQVLAGCAEGRAANAVAWVESIIYELEIPRLRSYGVEPGDFPVIIAKAGHSSSMKANPVQLSTEELNGALEMAM